MKNKIIPILILFVLFFCVFPVVESQAADVSGEVININLDQKVIFVDLGSDLLKVGDVMSVDGEDHPVYLEVLETSDAVSKLRISKNQKYYSNPSELDNVTIGMKLTRIASTVDNAHPVHDLLPAPLGGGSVAQTIPVAAPSLPSVDPAAFVKPDLAKESIQSIVDRMNTMVDGNVRLSNALQQCQSDLGESQKLVAGNDDLKKQIDELNAKYSDAVLDRDKYKKQAEDLLAKINELKTRLSHLDSIIGEH